MALDVKVTIKLAQAIGKAGSWYPLIYVIKDTDEEALYKEYTRLTEIAEDFEATTDAYKAANLIFMQNNAPDKIAICRGEADVMSGLANYMNKSWRQLIVLGEFNATVATAIEATDKMYFTNFPTTQALEAATTTIGKCDRTVAVVYKNDNVVCPEAVLIGVTAGLEAGSFTYKNMIVKGVPAFAISDTDLEALHEAGGITFVEKAGDIVTSEGISSSGEYIDLIDCKDWLVQNISYNVQKVFNLNDKVAYTDKGIGMLEAAVVGALVTGYNNGMIADNEDGTPAYSTSFAMRSQTSESDRATRKYPYGQFAFALAGAIHDCEITGEITV